MPMTIAQMRTQIRSIVDIDATDIADTTLNIILGQGYDSIVYSEKRWPFYEVSTTFPTADATKDYTLTTIADAPDIVTQGIREILALRTDRHVLEFIGNDDADWNYPLDVLTASVPYEWSFWNDTVRFYPTPNGVETIYVRALRNADAFGEGVADGIEPDLPDSFHPVLTTYGIAKAYLQQEDPVMAQQYHNSFVVELDNVARRFADTPAPQPMVVNSRIPTRYMAGYGRLRYANTGGVIW